MNISDCCYFWLGFGFFGCCYSIYVNDLWCALIFALNFVVWWLVLYFNSKK